MNTACGPVEYGEYGKGPPLLMVHGSGGGFDQGLDFARTLIPQGYRVIAPSRFGYLRKPLPEIRVASALPRYGLERISVPTLVIAAKDDLYGTYKSGQYTAQHIPGARFVGYPAGGHLLLEHRKDVLSELKGFLGGSSDR